MTTAFLEPTNIRRLADRRADRRHARSIGRRVATGETASRDSGEAVWRQDRRRGGHLAPTYRSDTPEPNATRKEYAYRVNHSHFLVRYSFLA